MAAFKRIGVLGHPMRPATAPVAERIAGYLQSRGAEAWCCGQWDDPQITDQVRDSDMVIAIGGDGSMLRASRVCARYGVPVLGVNMGHLGFLTEISEAEDWKQALGSVLRGDYWIEARMMIHAALLRAGLVLAEGDALNDVVISRQAATHMVLLETYIDKDWATTYNADALIIATATGSTAYALACGGPILPPELRNILIVPVAPHLSMDRPIVLSQGATVDVIPIPNGRNDVVVMVDGRMLWELQDGDRVRVRASDNVSRFVRMRSRNYFYRSLLDRLEPRIPLPSQPAWDEKNV